MKKVKYGILLAFSLLLSACSLLETTTPVVEGGHLKEQVKDADLYGLWAASSMDDDPMEFLLVKVMFPGNKGLDWLYINDTKAKEETEGVQHFTWKVDSKAKTYTQTITERTVRETGKKELKEKPNVVETGPLEIIQIDDEIVAVKLVGDNRQIPYIRMDEEMLRDFITDKAVADYILANMKK
ncbi:hypothetical protein VQ643_00065 [Pseudomonas sp. F1_0610]|uniref:hypothetical protein n=1 Tax=Pseudomonas sp. F1_0610 TaxID=3114284 RepID=UPI0039C1135C